MKPESTIIDAEAPPLLVRRLDAIAVAVPLAKPVVMGGGQRVDHSESLVVRIEAVNGMIGWGEASAAPSMTGDTLSSMLHAVDHFMRPRIVGQNVHERVMLSRTLSAAMAGNTGAKAACEIALYDLAGRHLGVPLVELLGGRARRSVRAIAQLGNLTLEDDIAEARLRQREGHSFFKLKVGVKSIEEEIAALLALRGALGPDVEICVDANTGMTPVGARRFVAGVLDAGILFLEQPFPAHDLAAAVAFSRVSPIPLCADEAARSLEDIVEWQRAGAIAGVTLKTIKLGGLTPAMRAAVVGDSLGLSINLASKTGESSIAAAALLHLGYAVPNLDWGINITNQFLVTDFARQPIRQRDGGFACPTGPGLGIEIDEDTIIRCRLPRDKGGE